MPISMSRILSRASVFALFTAIAAQAFAQGNFSYQIWGTEQPAFAPADHARFPTRQIVCFAKEGEPYLGGSIVIEIDDRDQLTHAVIFGGGVYAYVLTDPAHLKMFSNTAEMLNLIYSDSVRHDKVSITYDWRSNSGMASVMLQAGELGSQLDIPTGVNVTADINCQIGPMPESSEGD